MIRLRGAGVKRSPTHMTKAADDVAVVAVGETQLVYFPDDEGGRIVPVSRIQSIVPDYKHGGSMVFIVGVDKAIRVDHSPDEIIGDIR